MRWFIARRYLVSRSKHSVINIIAAVSLISVAVPVAAMIILLSVFNGFEGVVKDLYATTDADITILGISEADRATILDTEGVATTSFVIEGQALARTKERQTAISLRGADSCYFDVLPIDPESLQGSSTLTLGEMDKAILTRDIAQMLGIYTHIGNRVSFVSLTGAEIGSIMPIGGTQSAECFMAGIIPATQQLRATAIVPLRVAQKLFANSTMTAYVRTDTDGNIVKQRLQQRLGNDITIKTRAEKNELFYQIMEYEKWAVFFVALLVLIIASMSIIGTVIMLIVEKRDEQITLRSMGADQNFIRGIFIREGLLISGIGGAAGMVIGIAVVLLQQYAEIIKMPSANFVVSTYPVELRVVDIVAVIAVFIAVAWSVSRIAAATMIKKNREL